MPELPEVETVTQSIKRYLIGNKFESIIVNWKKTPHNFSVLDFNQKIKDKPILNVFRRAKYIILDFGDIFLGIHLRMTGKLYVVNEFDRKKKHISAYFSFGKKYLIFEDTRKFGRFYMFDTMRYLNDKLGVEPLDSVFTDDWIVSNFKHKKRQMKALLLDQSFICGIGNIYADEALWFAKIHPTSLSSDISKKKLLKLRQGIVLVLSESIKRGGTTIRDYTYDFSYVGNYALKLNVFGKEGQACPRCANIIVKTKVSQRGTHYCPSCQKK